MTNHVSRDQIQAARRADLYAFLTRHHDSSFHHEGDSIRLKGNHSISIRRGYSGYRDFSSDETGNAVEFLTRHMEYSFVAAVQALTEGASADTAAAMPMQQCRMANVPPQFPAPADGNRNLFAFLAKRGISARTIRMLLDRGLIYQEKSRNNIVFINYEKNFAELRGTFTYGKPFHGIVPNCRPDGFWWFRTSKNATKAYICEAAIDAISLYELHRMAGNADQAYYTSIAGAAKQPAINRLKQSGLTAVLAVDNDSAGQQCREHNPDLTYILPDHKDWNEDLQAFGQNSA